MPDIGNAKTKRPLPHIGDTVYSVHESTAGETAWHRSHEPYHFVVTSGEVIGFIEGGYKQAKVKNYLNGEYMLLSFPRLSAFGTTWFWTFEEACALAEKESDRYENVWGWSLKAPLLRPWRAVSERTER